LKARVAVEVVFEKNIRIFGVSRTPFGDTVFFNFTSRMLFVDQFIGVRFSISKCRLIWLSKLLFVSSVGIVVKWQHIANFFVLTPVVKRKKLQG
jgi:hypothetical protein